ncbi:DUF2490 domain-containing protein [Flammeovirga sp. EKP202]|uniref:DUF2490 domain-containing protein n=1 Tax=Flammeovirga sp. EKP202 TaxID=2770592 RepID=UPI00165F356C|nr:DUF2490 domain-containing protein [Flammeovirga sp. EKP202]MBD0400646.1 DUF2490 domain-containing protein [Flammeovirga sp. EKP202]
MTKTICHLIIGFVIVVITTNKSFAQDDILWLHYFNRYKLSYKFSIDSDVGYRFYFPEGERWQARSGLRYDINDNFYVRGGVMFVAGDAAREEFRPYQDFVFNSRLSIFTFTQRVRFEEQIFFDGTDTRFRLRYNPSVKFSTFFGYCTLGAEPFFVLNDPKSRVASNRLYIGLTRKAYKNVFVTLQYINERSYTKAESSFINESNMIRVKVSHTIKPLRTGPLFGRKKIST